MLFVYIYLYLFILIGYLYVRKCRKLYIMYIFTVISRYDDKPRNVYYIFYIPNSCVL